MQTTSCCPVCLRKINASKAAEGNEVYLIKKCPEHGDFKIMLSKDSKRFFDKTFSSPGKRVYEHQTKASKGCPDDCGLCPKHEQHLCSALIEITGKCNLACPACYFDDFQQPDIPIDEFKRRLDVVLRTENGRLDVLQISGGEPLLHGDFREVLEHAYAQDIGRILLNSNGISLLDNSDHYELVRDLRDKVEIYLQFDGFDKEANVFLRGKNVLGPKLKLIDKLEDDGIKICLAVTVIKETLGEARRILDYACGKKNISGVSFQRFIRCGAGGKLPIKTIVQEDIIQAIADTGYLKYKDIVPLPCSHENCTSISFLFVTPQKTYSLGEVFDYKSHQSILQNKISFQADILEYIKDNLQKECGSCCSWIKKNSTVVRKLMAFSEGKASSHLGMKILRITVKNFMDSYTFDAERAKKCCIGVSVGAGKIIPFCVNNIFRERRSDAI